MKVEVLDGSMEAPLLFYSDTKGLLKRDRPEGTYRVTAVKEGFQPLTRTLSVDSGETTLDTFYLERPDATIYGKVVDNLGDPLILATVTGVSEVGDTVRTRTDALGSYVLSCYEADWTIWVGKKGYTDAQARDTSVQYAQNVQMAPYRLALNPNVLSGVIKNENGDPLIGVQVGLLREGVLIDEVPSTPQNGVFSFQVESGTYRLTAGKTGFTSYSKSVDVLESKHLQIAMTSRAAVIKGAVYGKTWSTDRFVYAPITNATIQFIEKSTADTFLTVSDGVYGDFSISLPGGNEYFMHTSAEGYIARLRNATIATSKGQTHTVFDTLSGLATTRGRVTTSNDGDVVDRVTVNLIDDDGAVVATARSDLKGVFEIRDIPDGVYTVHAGKEGIVTDTVRLNGAAGDTACPRVIVNTGRLLAPTDDTDTLVVDSILIRVKEGNRYLTWAVTHDGAPLEGAAVKISSPLRKTLAPGDTVAGVGEGRYMLTIDADTAVIIDLAQHAFTIDDTTAPTAVDTTMDAEGGIDTVRYYHTEELTMPVSHVSPDSITLADGSTTLELVVDNATLDAGCLYYRDVASPVFDSSCLDSAKVESSGDTHNYTFPVSPRKNGSTMLYYFRVRIEDDWYGYATETFTAYVRPDTTRLSRIAIDPASADTLVLPADGEVTFNLKAYYGSKFIPATGLVAADVSWKAKRGTKAAPKNLLSETGGTAVTIDPTKGVLDVVYTLRAAIDTVRRSMAPNASSVDSVMFRISDNDLDSLKVMRVGGEEGPITTSTLAKAEFVAEGINTKGEVVTISPDWSIHPEEAGTISPRGVFKPSRDFFGWVELHADVGEVHGEYNRRAGKEINRSGLKVNYALSRSADTATTGRGCVVVFPDSLLPDGVSAQLGVDMPVVTNRVALNEGEYTVVSKLFDIELWDSRTGGAVPFAHGRTASLILDIPEDYHDVVESGSGDFTIGRWDADSIRWELLDSSAVDVETKTISVALEHFSRYAVLHSMKELKGVWSISPNPFSPRIRPVNEYGRNAPAGTCIRIKPVAKSEPITVQVDIYNLTSERVWSVIKQSAPKNGELRLWWDGTSLRDTYTIGGPRDIETDAGTQIRGERMCRNGRYFVVLTVTANDKKEQYMKPMILFK
jgi:hypothetical protein